MTKIEIGAIEKDLVEKTEIYEEITGISTEKLVEDLLNDFFEDIHITNDYINIDEIYYFNFSKLLEKREVIATKNKLSENLNEIFIIKKIPNNLHTIDFIAKKILKILLYFNIVYYLIIMKKQKH